MGINSKKSHYKIGFTVNDNGCWICHLPVNSAGYPTTTANGKNSTTHRYVYETTYGVVPDDIIIRHKCDEKRCINPSHLLRGTHADNVQDRVDRGRSAKGSRNGQARLKEEQVREIKKMLARCSYREIGMVFGVDRKTIRDIGEGKTWSHVE